MFVVFIRVFLNCPEVDAKESTPSVKLETHLLGESREVNLLLDSEDSFRVRPNATVGGMQVWDSRMQRWVENVGLWSQLPQVSGSIKMRFSKSGFPKKIFNLIFQDPITAKLYYSPQYTVWSAYYVQNYLSSLNSNLDEQNESSASKVWGW